MMLSYALTAACLHLALVATDTAAPEDPGTAAARVFASARHNVVVVDYAIRHDAGRFSANAIGVIVRADGLVMASSDYFPEQVQDQDFIDIKVWTDDGDERGPKHAYEGVLLGRDREANAAFLLMKGSEGERFPVIDFDRAATPRSGEPVVMLGVLPKFMSHARTFTLGRVTSSFEEPRRQFALSVELPLSGSPSSGIPIFALDGRPLGVLVTQVSDQGTEEQRERVSTLWPAENFAAALRNPPDPTRGDRSPWMGIIGMQDTSRELAAYWKLPAVTGVVTGYVVPGSPADQAGLRAEDVILSVSGRPVHTAVGSGVRNLIDQVRRRTIGEHLQLEVWRDGAVRQVDMLLAERPPDGTAAERFRIEDEFQFTVRELVFMDRFGRRLDMQQKGVLVSFMQPGWAADGGLQGSDIIIKMDDRPIADLKGFREMWTERIKAKPSEIVLTVIRGDTNEVILVRLDCRW